jgi:hypothetical protein
MPIYGCGLEVSGGFTEVLKKSAFVLIQSAAVEQ